MKLLLSYDGYLYKKNGNYYYSEMDELFLNRYLKIFKNIVLVLRTKEVNVLEDFYSTPLTDSRIEVCEVPMFQGPKEYAKAYFKVKKSIINASKKADIGIFRLPSTVGSIACKYFKKSKKAYLVEVVANPYESSKKLKNLILKLILIIVHYSLVHNCKHAKGVAYVSKIGLPNYYPANCAATVEFYSSVELKKDFYYKERSYPNRKPFKIIHIANNIVSSDSKGNVIAMHVMKELLQNGFDVNIVFIGERSDPNLFDDIANYLGVSEKVNFVGRKTKIELREFLIDSDLLLFPSRSEGLPRTVIEANAVGLPCVASNVGGIKELIDDEVIFDVEDYKGMANKIADIISNKQLYEYLSKNNFIKAHQYENTILERKRDRFYSVLLNNSNHSKLKE